MSSAAKPTKPAPTPIRMPDPRDPQADTYARCASCDDALDTDNAAPHALENGDYYCRECYVRLCSHDDREGPWDDECDLCGADGLAQGRD